MLILNNSIQWNPPIPGSGTAYIKVYILNIRRFPHFSLCIAIYYTYMKECVKPLQNQDTSLLVKLIVRMYIYVTLSQALPGSDTTCMHAIHDCHTYDNYTDFDQYSYQ